VLTKIIKEVYYGKIIILMDKKGVLELKEYTLGKIVHLCEYYRNENMLESSFSNWNVRDMIGHINGWLKYSVDLVEKTKFKEPMKVFSYNETEISNKGFYENNKDKTLESTLYEFKKLLERYNNLLDLLNEEKSLKCIFLTGVSCEMWEYMTWDLGIHPIRHMLYHYLKNSDFIEFINEIENSRRYFLEYSENKLDEFNFDEFFENKMKKDEIFKKMKENSINNGFIEEIIKINME
jgi:hypothetical protein